jgi:hypothetical protein
VLVLPWLLATVAVVLGVAGVLKVVDPAATGQMLRTLRLPSSALAVRLLGLVELGTALAVLMGAPWPATALFAMLWAAFAGSLTWIRRISPSTPCGCLGARSGPPTGRHLAVNLIATAVAISALLTRTDTTALWGSSTGGSLVAGLAVIAGAGATVFVLADTDTSQRRRRST